MLRAAHQLVDGEPRILVDAPIVQMVGAQAVEQIRAYASELQSPGSRGLRAHLVLRSRFAEDQLAAAVERGVRQLVILGAGLDTFAYRQPAWARALRIIEVDQPATQANKRERLSGAGIEIPSNVTLAPVDFETTSLRQALESNGVDLSTPVFFSWLGVTMYLTESAVDAVLRTVASLAPGSEIVFTFSQPPATDDNPTDGYTPSLAEAAAAMGEPWLTYFNVPALEAKLREFGFSDVDFLTQEAAHGRYFTGRTDGLFVPKRTSIVSAIV
jgi:methyltransferase (TIGR00027 family)